MEYCNKEEAIRAKDIALEKMEKMDFVGAQKFALKAQKLCSDLENLVQMILVCDVHCSAEERVCGDERDWYKILKIEPTADEASIKRQYNKLALSLHPDKNRFPGAADAFQLIREAKTVLADNEKRRWYDSRCRAEVLEELWKNRSSRVGDKQKCQQSQPGNDNRPNGRDGRKLDKRNRQGRFEGSMRNQKKNVASSEDGVVGDDDYNTGGKIFGDDEVDIVHVVKRSKCSGSFNVSAQEVDIQGKKRAQYASEPQENGKSLPNRKRGRVKERAKNGASVDDRGNSTKSFQFPANLASKIALDPKVLEYPDPEFNDFDKDRAKRCFKPGQIWATYDTLDAMPRFYALVNKVVSEDFKLQITWLEPCPENVEERKWLYQGLPASFGKLRLGYPDSIEDHAIFSHLVNWKKGINLRNIYEIYPRKGETWALFKNWDMNWCSNPDSHKVYEFELVEILTDYYNDVGVSVAFLSKIKGFSSLFSRRKEGKGREQIPVKDRFRFSHRVPSFQMTSKEGLNGIKTFFELDTASLPDNLSSIDVSKFSNISRDLN